MSEFLLTISQYFLSLSQDIQSTADDITNVGTFYDIIRLFLYNLSSVFASIASAFLDGVTATRAVEDRIDQLESEYTSFIEDFDITSIISDVWPSFGEFLADPWSWIVLTITDRVPLLAGFFNDPVAWLMQQLSEFLPIVETRGTLPIEYHEKRSMSIPMTPFYRVDNAQVGQGFRLSIPEPDFHDLDFYQFGLVDRADAARLRVTYEDKSRDLLYDWEIPAKDDFRVLGLGMWAGVLHAGADMTFTFISEGALAVGAVAKLSDRLYGEPELLIDLEPFGFELESSWSFDFSGLFSMDFEFFDRIKTDLYSLCEHILRYFWEGVW